MIGALLLLPMSATAQEPAPALDAAEVAPDADALYLRALEAWRAGQARIALLTARKALDAAGGDHPHAQLLLAFAHMRAGEHAAGVAQLEALTASPDTPPEIGKPAARALAVYRARSDRTAVSLAVGGQVAGRFNGEELVPGAGYSAALDVPLLGLFGPAVELSAYDTSAAEPLIEGPVLDLLGSFHAPLGDGAWALSLKVGPSIWFAGGALYGEALAPTVGTRAVLGADVRAWPAAGLSFALGAWAWPALADTLPAWMFGWDVRTGVIFWFPPSTGPSRPGAQVAGRGR